MGYPSCQQGNSSATSDLYMKTVDGQTHGHSELNEQEVIKQSNRQGLKGFKMLSLTLI